MIVDTNTLLVIIGFIPLLIGVGTLINPNLARLINLPGNSAVKAIGSIIVGLILISIGLFIPILPN